MNPSEREQERIADDVFTDRVIRTSVYCGRCGYNLRTLPYVYECPECGHAYNARPLTLHGVFLPEHAQLPQGVLFFAACIGISVVLFYGAFQPLDIWRLLGGVILSIFIGTEVPRIWRELHRYVAARKILRRIDQEEN